MLFNVSMYPHKHTLKMYVINFITYLLTPHQSNQVSSILLLLKFRLLL